MFKKVRRRKSLSLALARPVSSRFSAGQRRETF